jgi:CheY-like chemotaxis protein
MKTILVIDDDATNRLLLSTILEPQGHEIIEAADGIQALEMLTKLAPGLIIMDLHMPRMDGLEFLKTLRSDKRHAKCAVIIHTATSTDAALQSLIELYDVGGVLPKPFESPELLRMVAAAMDGA